MIGLGGAEFRLPLLIGLFGFPALEAVILNKAMSLVVVASALPFRAGSVPFASISGQWDVVLNLLAGSLVGAWLGAGWATRIKSETLYRVIALLLVIISLVLLLGHDAGGTGVPSFTSPFRIAAGVVSGLIIGIVAAVMGVAGGELLIPTLILLFNVDVKLAGSLSLAVSLPTMITAFARYSRDRSFQVLRHSLEFLAVMAAGSIVGSFIGGQLLGRASVLPELAQFGGSTRPLAI